ncbi:hypothetical protein [Massilia yuzhufengensis]|uniref:Uncharacterized protein n=1 Tax=Massilia yuzhufengensis TaxID=1164594 RepID=A0A1I1TVT5_9BURK|nr:hypothetical protein [Massilia yuzhufengensis]SFD62786.1 hypothetical protein SAMN05216204_13064 [Massilia yuzhufengensis]
MINCKGVHYFLAVVTHSQLHSWFESSKLRPSKAGEFDDGALRKFFACAGFMVAATVLADIVLPYTKRPRPVRYRLNQVNIDKLAQDLRKRGVASNYYRVGPWGQGFSDIRSRLRKTTGCSK